MDKLRYGIEPDSACMQGKRCISQRDRADTRNADVNRLGEHVLAVFGYTRFRASGAEEVVAPRRAVAADDVDHAVRPAERGHQRMEHVEFLRIVAADVLGAVIAQEVVQLIQRARKVGVADAVYDVDIFTRVQVVHPQVKLLLRTCLDGGVEIRRIDVDSFRGNR